MRTFWHVVEVFLLIIGYIVVWDIAATWVSANDWFLCAIGVLLAIGLLAVPIAVGKTVYYRLLTHFKGTP